MISKKKPVEQGGFAFDEPLPHTHEPVTQYQPRPAAPAQNAEFEARARAVIAEMADGFGIEDILDRLEVNRLARVGWHRARILECLVGFNGTHTAYDARPADDRPDHSMVIRYRRHVAGETDCSRMSSLDPCPECGRATPGGRQCHACRAAEQEAINRAEEDRLNRE